MKRRIEILAIGDELLDGRVADTNTLRLAAALAEVGLELMQRTSVRDVMEDIVREVCAVAARGTELCVLSGGLGPTADDLTSEALAHVAGVGLVRDPASVQDITAWLTGRGRKVGDNQLKQADRPAGAEVIPNSSGTAPGFAMQVGGCRFVAVPGVPREFDAMIERAVLAPLRAEAQPLGRRVVKTIGLVEADVDRRLVELPRLAPEVRVGFRVKFPEIHVSLTAPVTAAAALERACEHVRATLGASIFTESDEELATVVLRLLRERRQSLATAESCTGGLVADLVTDVPGSSDVFLGGVTAYAYPAKTDLLGVSNDTLTREGAVSEATAHEMAEGARARFGATWAVSASGIAGPGGGSAEKPVGTIWIAASGPRGTTTRLLKLPFDRRGNKLVAAYSALDLLRRELSSQP